jgi:hypothetical protein
MAKQKIEKKAPSAEIPDNPDKTTPYNPVETMPDNPVETTPDNPNETTPDNPDEMTPDNPDKTTPDNPDETTPETPDEHQEKADELMQRMHIGKIYRTIDEQWFSDLQNAEAHAKKIECEIYTYTPSKTE